MKQEIYLIDAFNAENLEKWIKVINTFDENKEISIYIESSGGETRVRNILLLKLKNFKHKKIYCMGDIGSNAVFLFLMLEGEKFILCDSLFSIHYTGYEDIREAKTNLLNKFDIFKTNKKLVDKYGNKFKVSIQAQVYERALLKTILTDKELNDILKEKVVDIDAKTRLKDVTILNPFKDY